MALPTLKELRRRERARHVGSPDPLYKKFIIQRGKAKEHGIEWRLEYWEWLQIWQDSGHLHERGIRKGQWVMARHGDTGAYEASNIKIIRTETNVSDAFQKSCKWRT